MIKILFICTGNICRSPMAEFIFKDLLRKSGLAGDFYVASAATSDEEIWRGVGNPVYPPAKKILAAHGLSCEGKRAVQLKRSDYETYDYLICMDESNMRNARRILGGDPEGKLHKLLEFAGETRSADYSGHSGQARGMTASRCDAGAWDIADPWYTGDFETAYEEIAEGCEGLLRRLTTVN